MNEIAIQKGVCVHCGRDIIRVPFWETDIGWIWKWGHPTAPGAQAMVLNCDVRAEPAVSSPR